MGAKTLKGRLCDALTDLDHVEEGGGVFDVSERAFFVNGRLVVEFAGSNYVGLRLTWPAIRELKATLATDDRVDRPIKSRSDWIYVTFKRATDLPFIVGLVESAVPLYLPADGSAVRPPPSGADLERRRRFH